MEVAGEWSFLGFFAEASTPLDLDPEKQQEDRRIDQQTPLSSCCFVI